MARFVTLFSSSSGNSCYIGSASEGILIDAGRNAKQLEAALNYHDIPPGIIKAIFITHEHNDHIGALKVFANRHKLPVFCSNGTYAALERGGHLNGSFYSGIIKKDGLDAGGIFVKPFHTSHDTNESTGFTALLPDGRKAGVATDTGVPTDEMMAALSACDLVLIEANHDLRMLINGPYPYIIKQRVKSDFGHLSNEVCAGAANYLVSGGVTRVVLGHLSRQNNTPELAYGTVKNSLDESGAKEKTDYLLEIAPEDAMRKIITF
ncbi:MAG: MBL fold metallo-hydrolase [Oscillospiraceae bacterium]|nr:MBL fold metallo-hydrolase [Oscillospiraceae bacterium]